MNTLFLVGTPLDDASDFDSSTLEILKLCGTLIGESKKTTDRLLRSIDKSAERFYLDPPRKDQWEILEAHLKALPQDSKVALFSDTGMPVLFDPGIQVLDLCKKLRFQIRVKPAATSWATACAVSAFSPPFYIQGFLDRETANREKQLKILKNTNAHIVLMETPYRYLPFLKQLIAAFGPKQKAFLAWEIAKPEETYLWGSLSDLETLSHQRKLEKGEFILILEKDFR